MSNKDSQVSFTRDRPLCYMHIPKTGGTSVRHMLGRIFSDADLQTDFPNHTNSNWCSDDELQAIAYASHFDKRFWHGRTIQPRYITALRNPIDRLISLYYFWRSKSFNFYDAESPMFMTPKQCHRLSFEEFVNSHNYGIARYVFNAQSRQLTSGLHSPFHGTDQDLLEDILGQLFDYEIVGVTNRLNEMMSFMGERFGQGTIAIPGRKNANRSWKKEFPVTFSARPVSVPKRIEARLLSLNLVDATVYHWASQRWDNGGYTKARDWSKNLDASMKYLRNLKSELGVPESSSVRFYSQENRSANFNNWAKVKIYNAFGSQLDLCESKIYHNHASIDGFKIVRVDSSKPAPDSLEIRHENVLGLIDQNDLMGGVADSFEIGKGMEILSWKDHDFEVSPCVDAEFDPIHNVQHLERFEILLGRSRRDLHDFTYHERSLEFLISRYFKHPHTAYSARIVINGETLAPLGVLVYSIKDRYANLVEYIGAFADFEDTLKSVFSKEKLNLLEARFALPEGMAESFGIRSEKATLSNFKCVHTLPSDKGQRQPSIKVFMTMGDSLFC